MDATRNRIYLSPPQLSGFEIERIMEVFKSNWIAPLGPEVDLFEKEIAEFTGVAGALAVSSATAAIHLGLRSFDIKPGDIVFCSTLTFVGSVNPVLYLGAQPVFIDSEPQSWNMSPEALKKAFKDAERTGKLPKAVIAVNLYGQNADMVPILEICSHYGVPVMEDAAESLGAIYKGKASGSWGRVGIFSFNGNKIITTSGGGMLLSDDLEVLNKARFWATQARDPAPWYEHSEMGYNYRMSNILASVGRAQFKVLEERVLARRNVFERYRKALSCIEGIGFMPEADYGRSNRWLSVVTIAQDKLGKIPQDIINAMESENIECRRVWKPMHMQPLFKGNAYYSHYDDTSISDQLFDTGICLPSGSSLTEEEQDRVIERFLCYL